MRMIEFLSRLGGLLSLCFDPTHRSGNITSEYAVRFAHPNVRLRLAHRIPPRTLGVIGVVRSINKKWQMK